LSKKRRKRRKTKRALRIRTQILPDKVFKIIRRDKTQTSRMFSISEVKGLEDGTNYGAILIILTRISFHINGTIGVDLFIKLLHQEKPQK
jgi:hypothetical protein